MKNQMKFTERVHKSKDEKRKRILFLNRESSTLYKITKLDLTIIGVLTFLYAIIAFYNLGSLKTPQTFYTPKAEVESFYIDFGKTVNLDNIYYFTGMVNRKEPDINMSMLIESSEDGKIYKKAKVLKISKGYVWSWQISELALRGRYLKVELNAKGIMLNEFVFTGDGIRKPLRIEQIFLDNNSEINLSDINKLFDEQNTVVYKPTFYDGTYFDEIYHARTAYEQINHLDPYEWTHPPLGKSIIGIGIKLFGMTPFGWRVMGTSFGIAMLPLMYLLAKKLFGKTEIALLTAFLMVFDFMHFTQTRIATIDVYGVFFIILMYYYMYKYFAGNFNKDKYRRTIITLGLCGLTFALGAASKWICLYAGGGLAILFFSNTFFRIIEHIKTKKLTSINNDEVKMEIIKLFPKKLTKILLWCIVFFILIPMFVYYLSYIPFMKVPGHTNSVEWVINQQKTIYSYHKNVTGGLEQASSWWEWPMIKTPKLYAYNYANSTSSKVAEIAILGNPAVWWIGSIAMLLVLILGIKKKDKVAYFIIIGFLSQYLPWIIAPRKVTYIYHFFASVPFLILATAYIFKLLLDRYKSTKYIMYVYMLVVFILFVIYYPAISGFPVKPSYLKDFLKLF